MLVRCPSQVNVISKTKDVEMNRYYNHIKHLIDTDRQVKSEKSSRTQSQAGKHDANQLDCKQRHTGFDYYEYDGPKFGTPGSRLNFQEHLDDLEHDRGRHHGIHGHGQGEACYQQRIQIVETRITGIKEVHSHRSFDPFIFTNECCRNGCAVVHQLRI
jgi:hypothetical protein